MLNFILSYYDKTSNLVGFAPSFPRIQDELLTICTTSAYVPRHRHDQGQLQLSLYSSARASVSFNIDSNGVLLGASGVIVNGQSYDVQFTNGSCNSLFSNCDPTQFTFHDSAPTIAAAQALLDQVFIDLSSTMNFDSNPALTNGCSLPNACQALTPFANLGSSFQAADSFNASPTFSSDHTDEKFVLSSYDTINHDLGPQDFTFAIWTTSTVPEPATLMLLGLGCFVHSFISMRRRRKLV